MAHDETLFGGDFEIEPTPGQKNRTNAQRAAWRRRQRKSRASRKLAARVENVAPEVVQRNQAVAAHIADQAAEQQQWRDAQHLEYIGALGVVWGALTLNRCLADRVFEQLEPEAFPPGRDFVFAAARRIHQRGELVTRQTLEKEVKKAGVTLLHPLRWLDELTSSPLFPKSVTFEQIDQSARILKRA